jgi:hypothetical protein
VGGFSEAGRNRHCGVVIGRTVAVLESLRFYEQANDGLVDDALTLKGASARDGRDQIIISAGSDPEHWVFNLNCARFLRINDDQARQCG